MSHLTKENLDVVKDPLDLRDLMYEGSLTELPRWIDNRRKVPFVLDQGNEGACTGFGLAAVVNYLMHNRSRADILVQDEGASARMLYETAKRYDDWEGTNYDGSSIRAAMKGWQKHGVCSETVWPYKKNAKKERLTAQRQRDSLNRPLGNYFRVRHLHLSHMHSALAEAEVLYASASVHLGWDDVDPKTGIIPFTDAVDGGHAFAIVGYNDIGFWIQNSWGLEWGRDGFALLTYNDWLENGWDCWVARMGVSMKSYASGEGGKIGRALQFKFILHGSFVASQIRPHYVNIGNDGRLSDSGKFKTDEEDVDEILHEHLPSVTSTWKAPQKLLLYAHGGLNHEKASAQRIASFRPYFLANQIYPLHFMWETGLWDAIKGIAMDAFRARRFGDAWGEVKERFLDLADQAIELASRNLGRPIWSQMKQNAKAASQDGGGADHLVGRIADEVLNGRDLELHLVGHSAGSILLGYLIPEIWLWGLKIKTLTLFAPACTTDLFVSNYLPYLGRGGCIERITIFNLNDQYERADNVIKVYNKSLLYLVSEAFEQERKQSILGIDKHLNDHDSIDKLFKKPKYRGRSALAYTFGGPEVKLRSDSESHGGFDNDPDTLNSTLRIIVGSDTLSKEFPKK